LITGRGPGAPSVTPGMVSTRRRAPHGQAVDLTAIRRTDAILDLLARRRLLRPRALGDPAITLLSSLAADVDTRPAPAEPQAGAAARPQGRTRPGPLAGRRYAGAHRRRAAVPPVPAVAAAAAVTVAAAVAAAGMAVAGMLTRLGGAARGGRVRR
jgi:hypothetical protein